MIGQHNTIYLMEHGFKGLTKKAIEILHPQVCGILVVVVEGKKNDVLIVTTITRVLRVQNDVANKDDVCLPQTIFSSSPPPPLPNPRYEYG